MNVGDMIQLPKGLIQHWGLATGIALLVEKLPRADCLQYDWRIFVDNRSIELGRQLEISATRVLNEVGS